jgi:ureidoacrylate peracid hydrolase
MSEHQSVRFPDAVSGKGVVIEMETLEKKTFPSGCALVIIDVQNDYCHDNGALSLFGRKVSDIRRILPRLKVVLDKARQTRVLIIHVRMSNNELTKSTAYLEHRGRRTRGDRQVCQEGTWGAEFYEIEPQAGEPVVTKHRYSAFVNTNFETILRARGIKTVILAGVTTDVCVESTARDGFMRDYDVLLLSDCTGVDDPVVQQATLERIERYFGHVVSSDEVFQAWDRWQSKT